jgi:hypothetical protein
MICIERKVASCFIVNLLVEVISTSFLLGSNYVIQKLICRVGFVLGSFGLGESREERVPLLKAVIVSIFSDDPSSQFNEQKELPKDKVRILPGLGSPEEVLDCVEQGIDLFNTKYPQKHFHKNHQNFPSFCEVIPM